MKKILEIKSAEGGKDSKLFVAELFGAYRKMFDRLNWNYETLTETEGYVKVSVSGKKASRLSAENGGHRIQRIPPTETKGRVHTSTVVVSVTDESKHKDIFLSEPHLNYGWFSGTGNGGQHRNRHQNCLRLTDLRYNITVTQQGRKRESNVRLAKEELLRRINERVGNNISTQQSSAKKENFGSGMRGDKAYTLRFQDDTAVSHLTGKRTTIKKYMRGYMDLTWP